MVRPCTYLGGAGLAKWLPQTRGLKPGANSNMNSTLVYLYVTGIHIHIDMPIRIHVHTSIRIRISIHELFKYIEVRRLLGGVLDTWEV